MRLDKFLKISRVIKRRTVANDAADSGRVSVNGKVVKPSYEVKVGDIVQIKFGDKISKFEILDHWKWVSLSDHLPLSFEIE